jgi:hypothetical protein
MRNAYRILRKSEGKRPRGRLGSSWEDIIKLLFIEK